MCVHQEWKGVQRTAGNPPVPNACNGPVVLDSAAHVPSVLHAFYVADICYATTSSGLRMFNQAIDVLLVSTPPTAPLPSRLGAPKPKPEGLPKPMPKQLLVA